MWLIEIYHNIYFVTQSNEPALETTYKSLNFWKAIIIRLVLILLFIVVQIVYVLWHKDSEVTVGDWYVSYTTTILSVKLSLSGLTNCGPSTISGGIDLSQHWLMLQPVTWHHFITLQWRHNERDGVWNHQPYDCLLNRLFKAQIKENIKAPRHRPMCGEFASPFPAQRTSNSEKVSIWWRHHHPNQCWLIIGGICGIQTRTICHKIFVISL